MMYCITNDRGKRLGERTYESVRAVRRAARGFMKEARIMIFVTDDMGVIQRYSGKDTSAVYKKTIPVRKTGTRPWP